MELPETYLSNQKEREYITQLRKKSNLTANERRILKNADELMNVSIRNVLASDKITMFRCVAAEGPYIDLKKVICTNSKSQIIEGVMNNIPIIVKWYKGSRYDCSYESELYDKLKADGCPLPWFSTKFKFLNNKVLAVEKLENLTIDDDAIKIGKAVLMQLKHIHKIGVHCDIKPLNIMKRVYKGNVTYFLIDFGGLTTKPLEYGYSRFLWSQKWTSQKSHTKKQVTTAKNDFIELGYTMKAIQNWKFMNGKDGEYKTGFTGRLLEYMNRVNKIDPKNINIDKIHNELINILS